MPFSTAFKPILKPLTLCAALLLAGSAVITAAEAAPVQACAKYQRQNATWSHGYKVTGEVLSGAEMNVHAKKRTYDAGAHYYVVSWRKGGWSVMRLPGAEVPVVETSLSDQSGKPWIVRRGWTGC